MNITEPLLNKAGSDKGRKWASQPSDTDGSEFENLQRAMLHEPVAWEDLPPEASAFTCGERFFFAVFPEQAGEREAAAEFWQFHCGEDHPEFGYVSDFAAGAYDRITSEA